MIREYVRWALIIVSFLGLALNLKFDIDVHRFKIKCSLFSNYWSPSCKDKFLGLEKKYYVYLREVYLEEELFYEVLASTSVELNLFYSKILICFTYGSRDLSEEQIRDIREKNNGNKAKFIYKGKILDLAL